MLYGVLLALLAFFERDSFVERLERFLKDRRRVNLQFFLRNCREIVTFHLTIAEYHRIAFFEKGLQKIVTGRLSVTGAERDEWNAIVVVG